MDILGSLQKVGDALKDRVEADADNVFATLINKAAGKSDKKTKTPKTAAPTPVAAPASAPAKPAWLMPVIAGVAALIIGGVVVYAVTD